MTNSFNLARIMKRTVEKLTNRSTDIASCSLSRVLNSRLLTQRIPIVIRDDLSKFPNATAIFQVLTNKSLFIHSDKLLSLKSLFIVTRMRLSLAICFLDTGCAEKSALVLNSKSILRKSRS